MVNLELKAKEIRRTVLEMIVKAGRGHIGGSFSCVEILVALYYGGILKFNPHDPKWPERDRIILSKGHACPTLYAILADLGFFDKALLDSFCAEGSLLEGHPNSQIPGIEVGTGSLGHGLSIGCGMALAAKMDNKPYKTFVIMGDAECQEGSVWEAAMFAGKHNLDNLYAIIDHNNQGVLDFFSNSLDPLDIEFDIGELLGDMEDRFDAFGWYGDKEEDYGHDAESLVTILKYIKTSINKYAHPYIFKDSSKMPIAIIVNTVKGKGVSFMEGVPEYHHKVPSGADLEQARKELA